MDRVRCELVSWQDVDRCVSRVAGALRDAAMTPDAIVAIARGGYIPARLLCDHFDVHVLTSLRIVHYRTAMETEAQARLLEAVNVDLSGLQVLLVDDVSDTGDTLKLALDHLRSLRPKTLHSAVLHHKTTSLIEPDFYGRRLDYWSWLMYPWARMEDLSGLLQRLDPVPVSAQTVRVAVKDQLGLNVPDEVLQDLIRYMNLSAV